MKLNGLDLNKLHIFCTVIKHGGYSGASEELHLTKSAISQAVTNLESNLGKKLFLRVGNRLRPTDEGVKFNSDLAPHQASLQKAIDNLLGEKKKVSGELRIGAYFEFAKSKLMPVVEQFLRNHPDVSLRFRFESPSRLDQLLEEQKIDLSISIFPHHKTKLIRSYRLIKQELVLIAGKGLTNKEPTIDDLKNLPLIDYFTDHVLFRRWWRHHFNRKHFEPKVRVYAASAETVLELVRRRLGMGVVPRYLVQPYLDSGEINMISPQADRLFDYIWLNEWKEQRPNPIQMQFTRKLKTSFPESF